MVGKHWIEGQTKHFLTGQELKKKNYGKKNLKNLFQGFPKLCLAEDRIGDLP